MPARRTSTKSTRHNHKKRWSTKTHKRRQPSRKPARRVQQSSKKFEKSVKIANSLVTAGILEKMQSEGERKNEEYLQTRCDNMLQYLSFNLSSVNVGTENAQTLSLLQLAVGNQADQYRGKYINVQKIFLRFNIQMRDNIQALADNRYGPLAKTARRLRMLIVAPKSQLTPNGPLNLTTEDSLFLNYLGEEYGLEDAAQTPQLLPFEYMSAPINKKNWLVLKDHTYKLNFEQNFNVWAGNAGPPPVPGTAIPYGLIQGNGAATGYPQQDHRLGGGHSHLTVDHTIPIMKKVKMDGTTFRPEDLNMSYRCIFITDMPSLNKAQQQSINSNAIGLSLVSVSCRSFVQYIDA